jgi:hypothetical protein
MPVFVDATYNRSTAMDERFKLMEFINAQARNTSYRVIDLRDQGSPTNMQVYGERSAAEAALALATRNQLSLGETYNRTLLRINGSLSTDLEGKEVFVGLNRQESERYARLQLENEASDEFIDLDHKHREARTGLRIDSTEL